MTAAPNPPSSGAAADEPIAGGPAAIGGAEAIATGASAPAAAAGAPPAGWWRRNLGWLAGALALGACTLWMSYQDALEHYQVQNPLQPVDAPKDGWVRLEGARWRLVGAEAVPPRDRRLLGPVRKDAGVLLLRFEVIADSGTAAETLDRCRGHIVDAQGRRWDASPPGLPRLGGERLPDRCGSGQDSDFKPVSAVPGRPFVFRHAYLLPRALSTQGLEVRLEFPGSRTAEGRYLRFRL